MAITSIGVNDPLAVRAWSKKLAVEVSKATEIAPLIGTDTNSIIQLKDEIQKGAGDTVRFGLTGFATGSGPFQWALAAVIVIGVAIGSFYFLKRFREAEA